MFYTISGVNMENYHDDPIVQAAFMEAQKHINGHSQEIVVDSKNDQDNLIELKDKIAELEFEINSYREAMRTSQESLAKLDRSFNEIYKHDLLNKADIYLSYLATKKLLFSYGSKLGLNIHDLKTEISDAKFSFMNEEHDPLLGLGLPNEFEKLKNELQQVLISNKEDDNKKLLEIKSKGVYKNIGFEISSLNYLVEYWDNLSRNGDLKASYNLALAYKEKLLDLNSNTKAIELFTKCAEHGDGDAAYNLYLIFSNYSTKEYNDSLSEKYLELALKLGSMLLVNQKEQAKFKNNQRLKLNNLKSLGENDFFSFLSYIYEKNSYPNKHEQQKYIKESLNRKYSWSYFASKIHNLEFELVTKKDKILFSKTNTYYLNVLNKTDFDTSIVVEISLSDGTIIKKDLLIKKLSIISLPLVKNVSNEINVSSLYFIDQSDILAKRKFMLQINNA